MDRAAMSMTTMDVKKMNRRRVYGLIYEARSISKQEISMRLRMSLTTVTQNLKSLEEAGLIMKNGVYESTGGRKAQAIGINPAARAAVGAGLLKETAHIAAVDLYGNIIARRLLPIPFEAKDRYRKRLGEEINGFAASLPLAPSCVLGTGIALQGLISSDGSRVSYGEIMGCTGLTLESFARHIGFPCRLEHDSRAVACAKLWESRDVKNAVVLILNRNLGGALILDGKIYQGRDMHGGALEHLSIRPGGRKCYCGRKGCLEAYCSADSLRELSGESAGDFFAGLRAGDAAHRKLWQAYMENLALAVSNLNTLFDCGIILTGYLSSFMTQEDILMLTDMVKELSAFPPQSGLIVRSGYDEAAPAVGAALHYIRSFLDNIS